MESAAVIPFYNERRFIKQVTESVLAYTDIVIAVNDGSTDGGEAFLSPDKRLHLINLPVNRGKGYALRKGLEYTLELSVAKIVCLDGDLQHPPELIPEFLKALERFDLVTGKRARTLGVMPPQRILSNTITSGLLSLKLGVKIEDSQCGYRSIRGSIIRQILPDSTGYEAETEMLIKAARAKCPIGSIPIPTVYGAEESKMRAVAAITGFLRQLLR